MRNFRFFATLRMTKILNTLVVLGIAKNLNFKTPENHRFSGVVYFSLPIKEQRINTTRLLATIVEPIGMLPLISFY